MENGTIENPSLDKLNRASPIPTHSAEADRPTPRFAEQIQFLFFATKLVMVSFVFDS